MLKYQLKKGVTIEPGMAFRYKSIEELKALLYALGRKDTLARATATVDSSLKEAGLLIFSERNSLSGFKEENKIQEYITRKHLVRSNEYIVRKKDFFDKTEYDNGTKNNKGHISSITIANANQIIREDVKSKSLISEEIIALAKKTLENVDEIRIIRQPDFGFFTRTQDNKVSYEIIGPRDIRGAVQMFEKPIVGKKYITIYIPNKGETHLSTYVAATFKISNSKLKLVCESVSCTHDQEINDDIALNMALYYNCKLLPEVNLPHILTHAKQLGLYDLLQEPPKLALGMYVREQSNKYGKGVYLFSNITNKANIIVAQVAQWFESVDSARLADEFVYFDSNKVTNYTSMLILLGLYYKEMYLRKLLDDDKYKKAEASDICADVSFDNGKDKEEQLKQKINEMFSDNRFSDLERREALLDYMSTGSFDFFNKDPEFLKEKEEAKLRKSEAIQLSSKRFVCYAHPLNPDLKLYLNLDTKEKHFDFKGNIISYQGVEELICPKKDSIRQYDNASNLREQNDVNIDGCGFSEGLYSKNNKDKSIVELLSLLRTKAVKDKQYEFASDIRDIESRINTSNSTVVRNGIVTGNFEGSTIDHPSVNENANAHLKTMERVPVNRVQENLPKIKGLIDNDYTKLLEKIIFGEDFTVELSDINNCFNYVKEDRDENGIFILKFLIDKYIKNKNVRQINIEGIGSVLLVNKKTFDVPGGPQGFFDMMYKLKTIVFDSDEQLTDSVNKDASFEEGTSLDGKNVLIYTRKNGSKVIIE